MTASEFFQCIEFNTKNHDEFDVRGVAKKFAKFYVMFLWQNVCVHYTYIMNMKINAENLI